MMSDFPSRENARSERSARSSPPCSAGQPIRSVLLLSPPIPLAWATEMRPSSTFLTTSASAKAAMPCSARKPSISCLRACVSSSSGTKSASTSSHTVTTPRPWANHRPKLISSKFRSIFFTKIMTWGRQLRAVMGWADILTSAHRIRASYKPLRASPQAVVRSLRAKMSQTVTSADSAATAANGLMRNMTTIQAIPAVRLAIHGTRSVGRHEISPLKNANAATRLTVP